jgi:glycyl-tRNA synthetase beta chain
VAEKTQSADFLVEVGTEELPPKALRDLRDAFLAGVVAGLADHRLSHGEARSYASPRRLAVTVSALARRQPDREVTRKGPPAAIAFDAAGNPTKAGLAFAGKCGVSIGKLGRQKEDAGEWLSFSSIEAGREAAKLLPQIVQQALDALPVPRRMRWGASDAEFVRPVHWLVMLHGKSVIDGSVLGIAAGNQSRGHRFHAPGNLTIKSANEYASTLEKEGWVIADFDARRERIVSGVAQAAKDAGGIPLGSEQLYDEVAALTEWPVTLTGSFDVEFLELPREVIVATLTHHQRFFPLEDDSGNLLPSFVTVANIESREPQRVRGGNETVVRPRLADAAFFWRADQQKPLGDRVADLAGVVYQKGLGSLQDKVARVAVIAAALAARLGIDKQTVVRAAELAKCDLLTGMVAEFPELQGTMGRYYAELSGEPAEVCAAIGEHYLPRFAGDDLPQGETGCVLAIADRLDTLAGVFSLGRKPSGNRDPFGLRRAALGVIRIVIEQRLDIDITGFIRIAVDQQPVNGMDAAAVSDELYAFFIDRLRGYLLEQDATLTAEMFAAVRARNPQSLLDFSKRIIAVQKFMQLDAAVSLAIANKRTANILRQADSMESGVNTGLLSEAAELGLHEAMQKSRSAVAPLLERRSYTEALELLAGLREPVDRFFDDVMVMADDEAVRNNRLALLAELRLLFLDIADISRLTPVQE